MSTLPLKEAKLRIRSSNGKIYFTVDDLMNFQEFPEGPLVELVNGELFMTPSPNIDHQKVSSELHFQIKLFLKNNNQGQIFTTPIDVKFSEEDLTIPDLVFIENSRLNIIDKRSINGSPNLIIEIVSTNKKQDYVIKKELYQKFKVEEYWIVDPGDNLILVHILNEQNQYDRPKEYKFTDIIPVRQIKGFQINLGSVDQL